MKKLELKEEFKKALEEKGLYDKFMENAKERCKSLGITEDEYVKTLNKSESMSSLIYDSFIWRDTEEKGEGFCYWQNIKNMFI